MNMKGIESLKAIRKRNLNRIVVAHLNINSLRNKFDYLIEQITGNIDILMISETKLDSSFPTGQFLINGYSEPFRIDRNSQGGGIMLYVREDIPSKLVGVETSPTEGFYVEINLRKKKWLLCCSYNPNKNNIQFHLENLTKSLALYSSNYENLIILGDFNVSIDNSYMAGFCDTYDLRSLIMEPTCYKNPENPTCIDLILTNHHLSFQNSCVLETGLSDFHKMTVTIMKASFQRLQPRIIKYRDYRRFQNDVFREELLSELLDVSIGENEEDFSNFLDICKKNVNYHAPCKQKYVRGNHLPFMNKTLSKEIMKRTRLRNKFLKNKNDYNKTEFSKQRNYCVSLVRKSKKLYYSNLDEKNVTDNKTFSKTIKPFLSDKIVSREKVTLIEEEEFIESDSNAAQVLNTIFSNIVSNLKIAESANCDPISDNINDPVIKSIVKYRNHPSILKIGEVCNKKRCSLFSFSHVDNEQLLKEIQI